MVRAYCTLLISLLLCSAVFADVGYKMRHNSQTGRGDWVIDVDTLPPATSVTGWIDEGIYVHTVTSTDNVGIGSTIPQQKLDVIGNIKATSFIGTVTEADTLGTVTTRGSTTTNAVSLGTTTVSTGNLLVSTGNVGIGSSSPEYKLRLVGNAKTTGQYVSGKYTDTIASHAFAVNWNNGNVHYVVLENYATISMTLSNPIDGGRYMLILKQPSSGSGIITSWDSKILWTAGTAPTLTATVNKVDVVSLVYDGTNDKYYAGINQNF